MRSIEAKIWQQKVKSEEDATANSNIGILFSIGSKLLLVPARPGPSFVRNGMRRSFQKCGLVSSLKLIIEALQSLLAVAVRLR